MALFGLFGKKGSPEEIKKLEKKATAKFGPPENRAKALEELRDVASPAAYAALMQRFAVRVDPSQTDQEEKQFVFQVLVDAGQPAVAPLKEFVRKNEHPTWALRVLEKLVPPTEVVDTILETLEREGADYTRDPEKKITLIKNLAQFRDDRIVPRLLPFLADVSEDVSVAGLELVAEQPSQAALEALITALQRASELKSERLRRAAAAALATSKLSVKGHTPAVTAALPSGFTVDKEGVVQGR